MLASKNRLRKKNDIDNVFKKGKAVAGGLFFLRFVKNNLNTNRFAFVVSCKVSKKSVTRNKIKRRLREMIRKIIPDIRPGFDFLIITKPLIVDKNFEEIKRDINEVFYSKFNKAVSG
ncbi:MAG: ribonuclease P protein component [Candidatus Portnoybacteria bacterium]|nr:ribonuclease P protein component [Candidatus Portnoybacteria bacterium]